MSQLLRRRSALSRFKSACQTPHRLLSSGFALFLFIAVAHAAAAQHHATKQEKLEASALPAEIWHDPGDVATLDLINGAGGKADAPDPNATYKFIKEDPKGTSPKFDVEDEQGRRWRVKLGKEAQPETAATRLLWAAGYFVDEDYYLPEIKVSGLPKLHRGREFVSTGEHVLNVRLELRPKRAEKTGDWSWFDNPFTGTRELNGLRVMMAFLNNWDVNPDNNSVEVVDGGRKFFISDLGATFGKTGNYFQRSKGRVRDYERSPFIASETPDYVDFVLHTRPFFTYRLTNPRWYKERTHWQQVARGIPRADAKWIGQRLALLSDSQIRDCFRAAGYSRPEIDRYAKAVEKRIQELTSL